MVELQARFARVARGRKVSVKFESMGFFLAYDYSATFNADTNEVEILIRPGGAFEGAYRSLERYVEAKAEELDGIDRVPPGHVDYRREMRFWMTERIYDQFRVDLESAVTEKISQLERVRPGEGVFGEVTIEARTSSLRGLLAKVQSADAEVRQGVLSPQTVELLKSIGCS